MAFLAVVCLFLFAPYSPEPRFGVGVSLPVSHAEIYRNWAICSFFCFFFQLPAGLKLKLFIEQSQYIAELSHTAGARVVIHDQGQMPFPDNEGNDVLPSRSTSFAIRKVSSDKCKEAN